MEKLVSLYVTLLKVTEPLDNIKEDLLYLGFLNMDFKELRGNKRCNSEA